MALITLVVLGSVCTTSSPMSHRAFNWPSMAALNISGIFQPMRSGMGTP